MFVILEFISDRKFWDPSSRFQQAKIIKQKCISFHGNEVSSESRDSKSSACLPRTLNRGKRKHGKVEQEIYNLLPFPLSCIVFSPEYFATREPVEVNAGRDGRLKWRPDGILSSALIRAIISRPRSCGTPCNRETSPSAERIDRITGPCPGTVSIFQLNITAVCVFGELLVSDLYSVPSPFEMLRKHRGISAENASTVGKFEGKLFGLSWKR